MATAKKTTTTTTKGKANPPKRAASKTGTKKVIETKEDFVDAATSILNGEASGDDFVAPGEWNPWITGKEAKDKVKEHPYVVAVIDVYDGAVNEESHDFEWFKSMKAAKEWITDSVKSFNDDLKAGVEKPSAWSGFLAVLVKTANNEFVELKLAGFVDGEDNNTSKVRELFMKNSDAILWDDEFDFTERPKKAAAKKVTPKTLPKKGRRPRRTPQKAASAPVVSKGKANPPKARAASLKAARARKKAVTKAA